MNLLKYIKTILKVCFYILLILGALLLLLILFVKVWANCSTDEREFAYGVPIQIENKLEDDILVLLYPVKLKDSVPVRTNVKQVKIEKNSDDFIRYYLGKGITNLKDVVIGVAIWKASDIANPAIPKTPYITKTLYDPCFEIGPGKYGIFARIIVSEDTKPCNNLPDGVDNAIRIRGDSFDIEWVFIDEPDFKGYMSKYETTNHQYCNYLNSALVSGKIRIGSDNMVYGNSGKYKDLPYFKIAGDDNGSQIAFAADVFTVVTRDGYDMSNFPVVEVSWYGAMAFCEHYNYRLPTQEEWLAAADYDGSYKYGYGVTENTSLANYNSENPLLFTRYPYTTPVGYYGYFGYGLADMTGNLWEWTNTPWGKCYIACGSGWGIDRDCAISDSIHVPPNYNNSGVGFRVCRTEQEE